MPFPNKPTQFQPGQSGNPSGSPKGVPHSKTRLKRLLQLTENLTNPITEEIEGFTVAEQMDLAQIMKARKGDTAAYNTIMDRLEGKPGQALEVNKGGIDPIEELLIAYGIKERTPDDGQADANVPGSSQDEA